MSSKLGLLVTFLYVSVFSGNTLAWNTLTDQYDIHCKQGKKELHCDYRPLKTTGTPNILASANDKTLQVSKAASNNDTMAILFLVDTSDPNRQNVIEKNKVHIKELLTTLSPKQKAGLASFDKSIQVLSPIGTSTFLLSKSVNALKATGKTTELYRNLLAAIGHIKSFPASRKLIVLLSDGQAEDKAYFHSDVVKAARKHGVVINSIGYPRSVSLSVALQTIRRISEETGGEFIETDMSYNLPTQNIKSLLNNIERGRSFSISLEPLYQQDTTVDKITLTFKNKGDIQGISVPINIKLPKKPIKVEERVVTAKPAVRQSNEKNTNQPIQIITKQPDNQAINLWLWYGLPAAFIVIIIFILITLFLLWHRKPESDSSKTEYKPYAYLIADDENKTRYPITRTIWRIGRSKDNELTLNDTSLSRRHAEIHRKDDGTFDIVDMNSMNGVYINNEKVGKTVLHEGDVIEIGDVFLHFTQFAPEYSLEESTVMQKTKVPITH